MRARLVRWGGRAVLIAAVLFLCAAAADHRTALLGWRPGPAEVTAIIGAAGLYAGGLLLLACGWTCVLRAVGGPFVPRGPVARVWATTQIAKYVPGNVAHLAARHLALRGAGPSHRILAAAAVAEALSLTMVAGLAASLALSFAPLSLPSGTDRAVPWAAAAFAAILTGALALTARQLGRARAIEAAGALLAACAFFGLFGAATAVILAATVDLPPLAAATVGVAAWVVGYLTPGAPAGVGTREAAFVLLLGDLAPVPDLLLAAIVLRVATTLGDVLCFGVGLLMGRNPERRRRDGAGGQRRAETASGAA